MFFFGRDTPLIMLSYSVQIMSLLSSNAMQCSKSFTNTSMPNNYKHTAELLRQLVVGHFEHPESENWALTTFHLPPVPFFDGISFSRKKHVMKQNVLGDIRL